MSTETLQEMKNILELQKKLHIEEGPASIELRKDRLNRCISMLKEYSDEIIEDLQKEVKKLSDDGIAVLVTDHNVQQTLRICDRAYIIHNGKNLAEGNPKDLINNNLVKEAYLASTFKGDEFDQK